MSNIIERMRGVFTFDMSVFEEIAASKPWLDIAMMISANAALGMLTVTAAIAIKSPDSLRIGLPIIMIISLIGLVLAPVSMVLVAGLEHLLIKALGGQKGFGETLIIFAYLMPWTLVSSFLSMPFGAIGLGIIGSFLSLATSLASLAENILAVQRVHGMELVNAAAAVLVTMFIIVAVTIALAFAAAALVAGGLIAAGAGKLF